MDKKLTLHSMVCHNPKVVGQMVEGEIVLVLIDQNQVKVLNEVGSQIWELMDGRHTIAEIGTALCAEFDVSEQQAQEDTLDFIGELLDKGLVSYQAEK